MAPQGMFPTLARIANMPIDTYGALVALSLVLGTVWGFLLAHKRGIDRMDVAELAVVLIVGGFLGSKIFHTLFEAKGHVLNDGTLARGVVDLLRDDPWHAVRLFDPGYVFYGGMLGPVVFGLLFCFRRGYKDPLIFGDIAVPGVTLGIFLGRLGCFFSGCCYGRAFADGDVGWAVHFPATHATHGAAVHAVQLYDSLVGLVLFIVFVPRLGVLARVRKAKLHDGDCFLLMGMTYAVARALTESLRADGERGVWGMLSTSQLISIGVFCLCGVVLAIRHRRLHARQSAQRTSA
jgi:phosphatidylglycerol---prolipoprotein diacylglyceryl transferase